MRDALDVAIGWFDQLGNAMLRFIRGWGRVAARSPRGGWHLLAAVGTWIRGTYDGLPKTAAEAAARGKAFLLRAGCAGVVGLVLAWTAAAVLAQLGWLWGALAAAVVLFLLGWIGRPATAEGAPVAATAEQAAIAEALCKVLAGVSDPAQLRVSPLRDVYAEDAGRTGRTFTIGLPLGTTADKVTPHRAVLAQALGSKTDRISVTEGTNPGQAVVFVADKSPSEIPPAPWPLTEAASFDLCTPLPIGLTPEGTPVSLKLFSRDARGHLSGGAMLIGGVSGSGKTTFLRLILSAAALDDRAVICVADLKGDSDYDELAPALSWHRAHPTEATLADLAVMLGRAVEHMTAVFAGAAERVPFLVVIDECQLAVGKGADPAIANPLHRLITQGRSAGVYVVLCTQRPTQAAIGTDLSANLRDRVCFRVSQEATGQVVVGHRPDTENPHKFKQTEQGAATVDSPSFDGRVRMVEVKVTESGRIAASHPREPFPTEPEFPAYAPDAESPVQDPEPDPEDTMVHHIDAAWTAKLGDGIDRATADTLALILSTIDPRYYDTTGADVRAELKAAGIADRSIKGLVPGDPTKTARGYYRADFTKALGGGVTVTL